MKNKKLNIAIIIEIILILICIFSYKDFSSKCEGFECLGKVIPLYLLEICIPLIGINLFVIQKLRNKSYIPAILICAIAVISYFGYEYYIYSGKYNTKVSIEKILNADEEDEDEDEYEDEDDLNQKIEYFFYNNQLYYYYYIDTKTIFDRYEKGYIFKMNLDGSDNKKVCKLAVGDNFEYNFSNGDEIFYQTVLESKIEGSYYDSYRKINLKTCKDSEIINSKRVYYSDISYILSTKNNDEIKIYEIREDEDDNAEYYLHTYNFKKGKIISKTKLKNDEDIDNYIEKTNTIKINDYYLINNPSDNNDDNNNKVLLRILDGKGNIIIEEYDNGNLKDYKLDDDNIYLIYKNNEIKKIETKN